PPVSPYHSAIAGGSYSQPVCTDNKSLRSQTEDVGELTEQILGTNSGQLSGESTGVSIPENKDCAQQLQSLKSSAGSVPRLTTGQIQSAIDQGVNPIALREALIGLK